MLCTVFYPSFLLYPQPPGFAFLRLFPYNVYIDFNDFRREVSGHCTYSIHFPFVFHQEKAGIEYFYHKNVMIQL